jgi:hypothetical protein
MKQPRQTILVLLSVRLPLGELNFVSNRCLKFCKRARLIGRCRREDQVTRLGLPTATNSSREI